MLWHTAWYSIVSLLIHGQHFWKTHLLAGSRRFTPFLVTSCQANRSLLCSTSCTSCQQVATFWTVHLVAHPQILHLRLLGLRHSLCERAYVGGLIHAHAHTSASTRAPVWTHTPVHKRPHVYSHMSMKMCESVCVLVGYIHAHTHGCTHTHTYTTHILTHLRLYINSHVCVRMCPSCCVCLWAHTHTRAHIHTRAHTYTFLQTRTHSRTCAYSDAF